MISIILLAPKKAVPIIEAEAPRLMNTRENPSMKSRELKIMVRRFFNLLPEDDNWSIEVPVIKDI